MDSGLSRILRRDPSARTVIFCVDQQHADDMRRAMILANPDIVADDPEWVVRIVGDEGERRRLLETFTDPEQSSPVVATPSRLLSTGVDIPDLKYVVLFRPIGSPVEFKQIIGRGSRLYPDKGKTSFEIIDFVGATSHFADPDFDGYPVSIIDVTDDDTDEPSPDDTGDQPGPDLVAEPQPSFSPGHLDDSNGPPPPGAGDSEGHARPGKYVVDEGEFYVVAEAVQVPDTSTGKLVLTDYGQYVAGRVKQLASSPPDLAERWSRTPSRRQVIEALSAAGVSLAELMPPGDDEVDPLDLLVQVAWNLPARTRAERARRAREAHHAELEERSATARAVLTALLDRYAAYGVDEITSPEVVRLPPLSELGSPREIARALGESDGLHALVDEAQTWIYSSKVVS